MTPRAAGLVARLLFLQVRRVEHDDPGQLAGRAGGDDLAAKTALGEQRYPAAMIEVCVRQEEVIDLGRIEAEILGVLLVDLPGALVQAAVDQHAFSVAFDQVTGTGNAAISAMKGNVHTPSFRRTVDYSLRGACSPYAHPGIVWLVTSRAQYLVWVQCACCCSSTKREPDRAPAASEVQDGSGNRKLPY